MSAYIVEKNHIIYLTESARHCAQRGLGAGFRWHHAGELRTLPSTLSSRTVEVANMLWRENIRSVGARYGGSSGDLPGPVEETFEIVRADFRKTWVKYPVAQIFKSCACYAYQTCEHEGWPDSEAHSFIEALKRAAPTLLPSYDDAEWGAPEPDLTVYGPLKGTHAKAAGRGE